MRLLCVVCLFVSCFVVSSSSSSPSSSSSSSSSYLPFFFTFLCLFSFFKYPCRSVFCVLENHFRRRRVGRFKGFILISKIFLLT